MDSFYGVRWAIDKLRADATLTGLLGGLKVYWDGDVPEGTAYPYIVVGVQGVSPREGAIRSGPNTHILTPATLRTTVWGENNYTLIVPIAKRITVVLDGKSYESYESGTVFGCTHAGELPPRSIQEGNKQYKVLDILWALTAKE